MSAPRFLARRTALRLCLALVVAVLTTIASTGPALAHAYLESSNPADGATLTQAPHTLRLSFSEHVVLEGTRIHVVDGDGHAVPVTGLRLVTEDPTDTEEPAQIVGTLPTLRRNTYRVSWETLSSDDLHRTAGIFVFGVGRAVASGDFTETPPRAGESALRWLVLLGVALGLGGSLAGRLLQREPRLVDAVRRTRRLSGAGAAGAALAAVLLLADQLAPGGMSLERMMSSGYGVRWLVREAGLLALLAAVLTTGPQPAARRATTRGSTEGGGLRRGRRLARPLLVLGAGLSSTGTALLGHAGAGARPDLTRVLATAVHLTAALTWAGAVMCLAVVLAPAARTGEGTVAARRALRAFAGPATGCVTVMAVTGLYLSSSVVGSVDAALRTLYGRTLLLKLLLVAGTLALAALNHTRLRGRRDLDVPTRSVRAEAAAAVLVVAATAVLASGQPATQPQLVNRPVMATHGPLARQVQDLQEAVSVRPNRPGRNVVVVDVFDARRPAPAPIRSVEVSLAGSAPVEATPLADGHWSVPASDVAAGATTLTVTVRRAGLEDVTAAYPWTVGAARPARAALVSTAPLDGLLRSLAVGSAVAAALGWGGVLFVRRRRRLAGPRGGAGSGGTSGPGTHRCAEMARSTHRPHPDGGDGFPVKQTSGTGRRGGGAVRASAGHPDHMTSG